MPKPVQIGAATVLHGDCIALMPTVGQVDAIVTDPPYGLEFMGKEWDSFKVGRSAKYAVGGALEREAVARRSGKGGAGPVFVKRAAKRCGKCGKQAWSGSPCRCGAPEWQVDNSPLLAFQAWGEQWARAAYGALKPGGYLLAFGGTRTHHRIWCAIEDAGFVIQDTIMWLYGSGFPKGRTQLKPAFEPICVAHKPGGKRTLQIDECRVPIAPDDFAKTQRTGDYGPTTCGSVGFVVTEMRQPINPTGRWPANVCLSVPEDEYILRPDVTAAQKKALYRWLGSNA